MRMNENRSLLLEYAQHYSPRMHPVNCDAICQQSLLCEIRYVQTQQYEQCLNGTINIIDGMIEYA